MPSTVDVGAGRRRPDFIEVKTVCLRATGPKPAVAAVPPPPPAPDGELAPGTMVGEYRIDGKVGQGAMGVVYGASHPVLGRRAAIKVMRPLLVQGSEASARFLQEARAIGRIAHPNIVDAFGYGTLPDGRCWYAMEWLQGQTLGSLVRKGRLPLDEVVDILDQVTRALEAAHAHGIVHRDLKPDNIYLKELADGRPIVKLLDFSIAKLLDEEQAREPLTRTGVVIGTPAYVSPEQVRGAAVDARADIYALGVLTFEMLAGRLPFSPPEKIQLLHMHLSETPPMVSSLRAEVPAVLDAIVARMLAKHPDARPSLLEIRRVANDVRTELSKPFVPFVPVVIDEEALTPLKPPPPIGRDYGRRHLFVAMMLAAAALAFSTLALSHEGKGPFVAGPPVPGEIGLGALMALLPAPPRPAARAAPLAPPPEASAGPLRLEGEEAPNPAPRKRHPPSPTAKKKHKRPQVL